MKPFRTEIPPIVSPFHIDHEARILAMGSCFTSEVGERLEQNKFLLCSSPFGIVYHPLALARQLRRIIENRPYEADALFFHDECWHSFDHHGQFSHPQREYTLRHINLGLENAAYHLRENSVLLLTLGTANGFYHSESEQIVANCHKIPATYFERQQSSIDEINTALWKALQLLWEKHPDTRIVITVSPVRHLRDGLVENQRSKARLLLVAEQLAGADERIHYFPAYEMLLDDLRDYRFYDRDLSHPSDEAVDYIWNHFQQTYFSTSTRELLQKIEKVVNASRHRPFHPGRVAHQRFLRQQLQQLTQLEKTYPQLDFQRERDLFETDLLI